MSIIGDVYAEHQTPEAFWFRLTGEWWDGKYMKNVPEEELRALPADKLPERGTPILRRWDDYE